MNIVRVNVVHLRKNGFNSLQEWLDASPCNIYIGRKMKYVSGALQSKWANPFTSEKYGLEKALALYEEYIRTDEALFNDIMELHDKQLGCWCDPSKCHGAVLQKLIKETSSIASLASSARALLSEK
jgi:hypothetical protein